MSLKVSDTGGGISRDHLGKIFDPFFTTKREGTGLGLSICNKIIAEHRGTIRAESQLGQGTSMVISLPAVRILNSDGATPAIAGKDHDAISTKSLV